MASILEIFILTFTPDVQINLHLMVSLIKFQELQECVIEIAPMRTLSQPLNNNCDVAW